MYRALTSAPTAKLTAVASPDSTPAAAAGATTDWEPPRIGAASSSRCSGPNEGTALPEPYDLPPARQIAEFSACFEPAVGGRVS
jgi:hypothetical protein